MSSEMSSSIPHHQQHQQVPAFSQDGSGDKFGLNSSCSSDKFSTLDDMVSKIVDEETNLFSLNSLGHFSTASTTTTADDSHSQATSNIFSFDEYVVFFFRCMSVLVHIFCFRLHLFYVWSIVFALQIALGLRYII